MVLTDNRNGKFLYKYLPFNQYSLQLIINHELWLGSPDFLNDPFEGDFIIKNIKKFHNKEIIELLLKNSNYKEFLYDISFKEQTNDESKFKDVLYEYLNNSIKNTFGTTSFSKSCNSLTMWSHYADSHKGFVIIFDRDKLESTIKDHNTEIVEVVYGSISTIELIHIAGNISIINDKDLLSKKLLEWDGEEEVRIIRKNEYQYEFQRLLSFGIDCISGIIFGHRILFENIKTINRLILSGKNKNIPFYYALKNSDRNKIIFNKLPYPLV